jgi:AraC-like DNA-binding protein
MGMVLAVSSRALLRACEALGLDTQGMLDAAGIARDVIDDPDGRIELERVAVLWRTAYEASEDPDLALHAAEALPFGAYRVIDYLASRAATVGESLLGLARYFPLINTAVELRVDVGPEAVTLTASCPSDPPALTRAYAEYLFAALYLRTRDAGRTDYALRCVELTHPAPASSREHERVFGCPVRFGAAACRMTIDRAVWDTPLVAAEPSLYELLDDHAATLLGRLPAAPGITAQLRRAIAGELRGGDPSLERVARTLAMSTRTLQRRLGELGVSFADLVDEVRHAVAASYLADRAIAIGEVAYLLGFAEQSSFTRAFKRWTGQTPSDYRRGLG